MKKIALSLTGRQLLENPLLNKGTAFTKEEREEFHLDGLLPYYVSTIEEQAKRRYANFCEQTGDLAKYSFLSSLQHRNETLFYRLILDHLDEMVPLIYTPTVGSVSTHYSMLYREQRGLYLSYPLKEKMEQMVANYPIKEIDVIVVTDGERILGLGDLGVGGMAISTGKLALYSLFGGINPARTLPIVLDVGTNNEKMLSDLLYIGWRHKRVTGEEYYSFIESFIQAIKKNFPHVVLQWEDFARPNAEPLLNKYRKSLCSFNDDIQGTAAVVLAAIYSAMRVSKQSLKEQKFVVLGGGSAGIGICNQIVAALLDEGGITAEEARKLFYVVDRDGLIQEGNPKLYDSQRPFAQPKKEVQSWKVKDPNAISLLEVIHNVHPHVLIGVSTQGGAFTEEIVKAMNSYVKRPLILPLSNPNSRSEATPADIIQWTKGEGIVATGSPFEPVKYNQNTYQIAQCNNVYIFPGVGLGLISTKASYASDAVFIQAAKILAEHSPMAKNPYGPLFPTLNQLRSVIRQIGVAVAKIVIREGHSHLKSVDAVEILIDETIWSPEYPIYTKKK